MLVTTMSVKDASSGLAKSGDRQTNEIIRTMVSPKFLFKSEQVRGIATL